MREFTTRHYHFSVTQLCLYIKAVAHVCSCCCCSLLVFHAICMPQSAVYNCQQSVTGIMGYLTVCQICQMYFSIHAADCNWASNVLILRLCTLHTTAIALVGSSRKKSLLRLPIYIPTLGLEIVQNVIRRKCFLTFRLYTCRLSSITWAFWLFFRLGRGWRHWLLYIRPTLTCSFDNANLRWP